MVLTHCSLGFLLTCDHLHVCLGLYEWVCVCGIFVCFPSPTPEYKHTEGWDLSCSPLYPRAQPSAWDTIVSDTNRPVTGLSSSVYCLPPDNIELPWLDFLITLLFSLAFLR